MGVVVTASAYRADDPGSIPGRYKEVWNITNAAVNYNIDCEWL
jgi:hypothetical protein